MTEKLNEVPVPRKLKDAIALFESSGQPQEGGLRPRKDNLQHASPVAKAGLFSEAERVQNSLPRSKNAGLTVQPALQTLDYRSQLKGTGAERCTDQNDFRAHLKPKPKIALDIGLPADSKTENRTDQVLMDCSKVSERMACSQGLGKVHPSSQGKACETGSIAAPGKDFKLNLAKVLRGQNSPTPRTVFSPPPPPPPAKLSTDKTQSPSSTPDSRSALKGATTPFGVTPEPLVTRTQRKPVGNHATPKTLPGASGNASNHSNFTKTTDVFVRTDSNGKSNPQPSLPPKTTPISSQNSPDSKPVVANKSYTVPIPPMPKTGQNLKVIDRKESDSGKSGTWKSPSTQPNQYPQIISVRGKIYRLLPPPAANRDTCPRKPVRPPSVDLTQFIRHAFGSNEIWTAPSVPPLPQTNSKAAPTKRPVSLIPEWTEEDEAREAMAKAAQQGWVDEDDDNYEISNNCLRYVNDPRTWRRRTKDFTRNGEEITETNSQTCEKQFDAGSEIADASDDSDYENIDSFQ